VVRLLETGRPRGPSAMRVADGMSVVSRTARPRACVIVLV